MQAHLQERLKAYRRLADGVMKVLEDGAMVVVPWPVDWQTIVMDLHQTMGHFGVQQVLDRLQNNYWWRNMGDMVAEVIKACLLCACVISMTRSYIHYPFEEWGIARELILRDRYLPLKLATTMWWYVSNTLLSGSSSSPFLLSHHWIQHVVY